MGYAPMWLRRLRSLNLGPVLRHRSRFADFAELAACKTLGMERVETRERRNSTFALFQLAQYRTRSHRCRAASVVRARRHPCAQKLSEDRPRLLRLRRSIRLGAPKHSLWPPIMTTSRALSSLDER